MIIASAWSIAFIVLLFASIADTSPTEPLTPERIHVIGILFVGAVTGVGWLWFRHQSKKRNRQSV